LVFWDKYTTQSYNSWSKCNKKAAILPFKCKTKTIKRNYVHRLNKKLYYEKITWYTTLNGKTNWFSQTNDYIAISKKLVEAAKGKNIKRATNYMDLIAKADENTLIKQLEGDTEKSISLLMFTMVLQT
jgi:hypothetical protein